MRGGTFDTVTNPLVVAEPTPLGGGRDEDSTRKRISHVRSNTLERYKKVVLGEENPFLAALSEAHADLRASGAQGSKDRQGGGRN